jgi:hypothetical protein
MAIKAGMRAPASTPTDGAPRVHRARVADAAMRPARLRA